METKTVEIVEEAVEVKSPGMYQVVLHNDNTTTFEFVISILVRVFHRTVDDAIEIAREIHHKGQGIAGGPYTKEIAEEKTHETLSYARANGYPLVATYEEI